jgi:hypothetical protein
MRKVCVLIALAVTASGAIANPSAAAFSGLEYDPVVQTSTRLHGLIAAFEDDSPPLRTKAQTCFERPAAEELIRSIEGRSTDASPSLSLSPRGAVFLQVWLRSKCTLAVNSISNRR